MKKKKNKTILIIVGVIVVLVVAILVFLTFNVAKDLGQEEILTEEMEKISDLSNEDTLKADEIRVYLDRTLTKGDYAVVEETFKDYLSDILDNLETMNNILNDSKISQNLTIENYKTDGPDFVVTRQYIKDTIKSLEECKNKYYEYLTEEKAMSYIKNKKLDDYYIDLYKDEIVGDLSKEKNDQTMKTAIDQVNNVLTNSLIVIDFLTANKASWSIENNLVMFNSQELLDKYNELVENIKY